MSVVSGKGQVFTCSGSGVLPGRQVEGYASGGRKPYRGVLCVCGGGGGGVTQPKVWHQVVNMPEKTVAVNFQGNL